MDCEAEQVIDVPKIIIEDIPSRHSCREQQMAEQLAEVPTILNFLIHGFFPGQGSLQCTGEHIIDTPVRGRGVSRSLQGSPPRQGSSKRTAEQIADIPVPCGRRHGLSHDLHLAALTAVLPGEPEQVVFRTFSKFKKVHLPRRFRVRGCTGTRAHPS